MSTHRIDNRVRLSTLIRAEVIVNPVTGTYEVRLDEQSVRDEVAEAMLEARAQRDFAEMTNA